MVRELLDTGKYLLVNASSKVVGGPFTRFDPANPDRKSCLDLVIISKELSKYVFKLTIDKHLSFTPGRPVTKKKTTFSDHRSFILEFRNIPLRLKTSSAGVKFSMWNTNKTGGWEVYKMLTEKNEKLEEAAVVNADPTEAMKAIDAELNKVKFKAFGKVKIRNQPKGNKELQKLFKKKSELIIKNDGNTEEELMKIDQLMTENLLLEQRTNLDKELESLKDMKRKKGKSASIFALKNKIVGKKKLEQEATIIKNPANNEEVTDPDEIKRVSLEYCTTLLTNRKPKEKFEEDVKLKTIIHEKRMKEVIEEEMKFSMEIFEKSLKALKKKNSNK